MDKNNKYFVFAILCTVLLITVDQSDSYAISSDLENLEHKLDILLDSEDTESGLLEKLVEREREQANSDISISESKKKVSFEHEVKVEAPQISSTEILSQLTANSKRMESMVVLIVDLQSALFQAVSAQEKQMTLRTEVVELREEVDSLRHEIKTLRSEEAKSDESRLSSHLSNKIRNDETTINWLKESFLQLRHELTEVSSSINLTGLYQFKEQSKIQADITNSNINNLQNQVQKLESQQAQADENLMEIRGDVAEIRTQQANLGIENPNANTNEIEPRIVSELSDFQAELHAALIGQKHKRHENHSNKKLKTELQALENIVEKLATDQKLLHRNFRKLQKESHSETKIEIRNRNKRTATQEYGTTTTTTSSENYRLTTLEKIASDNSETLETLDKKVISLEQLKDSTKALFNVMEALETKYDGKINDIQTTLGRMETEANRVSLLSDDLKEEQTSFSKQLKSLTKDLRVEKEEREKNHLRIASTQSQILKLGLEKCVSEDENLIQKIEQKNA